jgi:C1A family cysteine protease
LTELQAKFPNEMYAMYNSNQLTFEDIVNQAKAMEKEQIINAMQPRLTNEQIDAMFNAKGVMNRDVFHYQRQAARQVRDLLQGEE